MAKLSNKKRRQAQKLALVAFAAFAVVIGALSAALNGLLGEPLKDEDYRHP